MRGIKIPQQDFALKRQGGLMHEGGHICGTLRYYELWFCETNEKYPLYGTQTLQYLC